MPDKKKQIYINSTDLKLFATMLKSGISPVEALSGISEKHGKRRKGEFHYLTEKLREGINFSEVFSETSVGKNKLYLNLLEGAENSGSIPEVMEEIATNIESSKVRKSQIIGVLIYPAIVLVMITALVLALLLFIVPNILPVIAMNPENLPLATEVLVFLSGFLKAKWIFIVACAMAALCVLFGLFLIPPFRYVLERIIFKIPIVKDFVYAYVSLGYSMALYQYIASSPDLPSVFNHLSNGTRSRTFKKEFRRVEKDIREGKALHIALGESGIVPPVWSLFTRVAEQTSSYAEMFKNLHHYYKEVFEQMSRLLMKLAEPVLMITIGLIVGVLAYGIMAPLYGIMNSLK